MWNNTESIVEINNTDICLIQKVSNTEHVHQFLPEFSKVVMATITSSNLNVLRNGEGHTFFPPKKGLRQGYLISPYLFILCMYKLSHMISESVDAGLLKGLKANKKWPIISHLMFVVIYFCLERLQKTK